MAGITETKQFKITPDGKIELVVTDEVELLALATRYAVYSADNFYCGHSGQSVSCFSQRT